MKILLSIIIYLTFQFLIGQEVKYIPIFLDACDSTSIENSKSICITDYSLDTTLGNSCFILFGYQEIEGFYLFENDTVTLPDTGVYRYYVYGMSKSPDLNGQMIVNVSHYGINTDTFYIPKFRLRDIDTTEKKNSTIYKTRYKDCDSLANGKYTGYYYDGRLRISGNFKDGIPKDTLKHYHYATGNLSKMAFSTKNGYTEYEYLKDGSPYSKRENIKGLFKLWAVQNYYVLDTLKEKTRWFQCHIIPQKNMKYSDGGHLLEKEIWSIILIMN